jgi:KipI family sensor histidine kinase inhibitor
MLGFAPGFAYLLGLPETLATPRLTTPRLRVPSGSVGIAGAQTGVYALETPGGWRIIGQTALTLFDPAREAPFALHASDCVRFVPL